MSSSPTEGGLAPTQAASAAEPPTDEKGARWSLRRLAASLVLLAAAVGFGFGAFALYPATTQLPTPSYASLGFVTTKPISFIRYQVDQTSPTVAEMKIIVELPVITQGIGIKAPPKALEGAAKLVVSPPIGTLFTTCPAGSCEKASNGVSTWIAPLTFVRKSANGAWTQTALVRLYVAARSFGETHNATNASVAIPQMRTLYSELSPGSPTLLTQYNIPSANNYDWTAFPVELATRTFATWSEQAINGNANGATAVGINHANQSSDDNHTFISGALLGLAGGALLSAFQEFIHRNDH